MSNHFPQDDVNWMVERAMVSPINGVTKLARYQLDTGLVKDLE